MKYSINSAGRIVAERDIYSLGGFIPKGLVGAKVANEDQISQDGECWVAGGDISARPDVRIKDNAYIGNFAFSSGVHTDGITEFSGNTLIPGPVVVRNLVEDPVNSFFVKDSFIGVSMDVLCGPEADTTVFPFEQGGLNKDVPAGTLFTSASMHTGDANICRTTANLCLGKDTYLYIPTGYSCRVLWGYRNTAGQLAYSGESFATSRALTKLEHPTYKMAMIQIAKVNGTAMTPADLLATGAKILGHISGSASVDIRPESASGQYVMNKSCLIVNTSNFGLAAAQKRILAGGLFKSTVYTPDDVAEYKVYGTFHNVQRLEYAKYLSDSHRTVATRDRYISAYDCPLLRVDNSTYDDALAAKGDLVLRRCIVPKAMFPDNIHNGNVYEDIDFSYAGDHLGAKAGNNYDMWSSHKQGEYAAIGAGTAIAGLISRPENLAAGSILGPGVDSVPLDGSLLEQGAYGGGSQIPYESAKSASAIRIRTGKPVKTAGLIFPSLPAGYSVKALYYLDEDFIIRSSVTDPTGLDTTYPYVVMVFRKDNDSAINITDFIALNRTLRMTDHTKAPEITGSAYVGAGCTVRGDVKLIGDPYVNRALDVNAWERGTVQSGDLPSRPTWSDRKIPAGAGNRFRSVDTFEVELGGTFSCADGYLILLYRFDGSGKWIDQSGWATSQYIPEGETRFAGLTIKKATNISDDGGLITEEDLALANVKYVRAFKKRRYIVNELDRTSPEDILLKPGDFGNFYAVRTPGGTYGSGKTPNANILSLHRPVNVPGIGTTINYAVGVMPSYGSLDALTRFISADIGLFPNTVFFGGGFGKNPAAATPPSEAPDARLIIEFTPSPRIVVPYGSSNLFISGPKIRMYDNVVLSRNLNQEGGIVLQGDAVMGYDFNPGECLCSNGHSDAIIKLP